MTLTRYLAGALTLAVTATTLGCSSHSPTTTGPATADRKVQSLGQDESFLNLPQRISVADAEKMLVKIDPGKVAQGNLKHTQCWGCAFALSAAGWVWPFNEVYATMLYYPYRAIYYPYSLVGNYYYPYTYGGYSPYLYGYSGLYYPYYRRGWW